MGEVIFRFNREDIQNKIEQDLRQQVKSYATTIGLASFDLQKYIQGNKELQDLIKKEINNKLKDKVFMKKMIKEIVEETIAKKIRI